MGSTGLARADRRSGRDSGHLGRLARFTARYRWPVIGAWIVLTVFGGFAAGKLSSRWYQSLSVPGKPAYEAGQRTLKALGAGVARARRRRLPLTGRTRPRTRDRGGDAARRGDDAGRAARARTSRPASLMYVSSDRHTTFEEVYPPGPTGSTTRAARRRCAPRLRTASRPASPSTSRATTRSRRRSTHGSGGGSSVLLEAVIGGLGALVILLFVFGTLPAVLMPLVVAVAAILNTFTLVWALTYVTDVSIIVQFLIALVGLGVAIDYALLMIFRFRDELREGNDVESALVETMTHAGRSVIVSGTTVAIGLLSMVAPAAAAAPLDGPRRHADPRSSRCSPRSRCCRRCSPSSATRINSVRVMPRRLDRPRPSRGRRLGPLGALRAPAPGRGRGRRPRDRRRARGPRDAAERERGPAEELPRHRHRDRRPRSARRRRHQPRRDEAARRPRRARRRPRADRGQAAHGAGSGRGDRAADLALAGTTSLVEAFPADRRLRTRHPGDRRPRQRRLKGTNGTLTGVAAVDRDFVHALFGSFPYVLAFVLLLTLILLTRAFRSIVLALKAVLLNLVSLAAAFGIVVFIFQQGHGSSLWGVEATSSVTA